ncbi:MAG TPA: peptide chain release factor N(5)-glutamine methyltransferase [Oligoflexia bacterium]|nr:peptide chain release factor N(5)-glutamine methyltransferase [Oligoflexia bacterium]HMR24901.1 peptide chain release factor N(5)-glutamine methyltransferase [Oligoflexia bacterium]
MTIGEAIVWGKHQLTQAEKDDAGLAPAIFLQSICHYTNIQLYLQTDTVLTSLQEQQYKDCIAARAQGKPVAYIMGEKEFYGLDFKVNENVLIPRPETELIVDEVLSLHHQGIEFKSILDVGTGSGALAVTLKHYLPYAQVTAVDISEKALELAQFNAQKHATQINFIISDLLQNVKQSYDLIVANLPYVSWSDKMSLSQEVRHEPEEALFADQEGLGLYIRFIKQAAKQLNPKGMVLCEFGIDQSRAIKKIFEQSTFTVLKNIKDLSQIDRVIVAQLSQ